MNAAEIVRLAIRDSRNENRPVFLSSDTPGDRTQAHELFELLFAASEESIDDRCYQLFWGEGWHISLYYPHL